MVVLNIRAPNGDVYDVPVSGLDVNLHVVEELINSRYFKKNPRAVTFVYRGNTLDKDLSLGDQHITSDSVIIIVTKPGQTRQEPTSAASVAPADVAPAASTSSATSAASTSSATSSATSAASTSSATSAASTSSATSAASTSSATSAASTSSATSAASTSSAASASTGSASAIPYICQYNGSDVAKAIKADPTILYNVMNLIAQSNPFFLSYLAVNPGMARDYVDKTLADPAFTMTVMGADETEDVIKALLMNPLGSNPYQIDSNNIEYILSVTDLTDTEQNRDKIKSMYLMTDRDVAKTIRLVEPGATLLVR